jgi:hypothetical protein
MAKKDKNIWPFSDPENVAFITLKGNISREQPILLVTHDAEDGGWQFLDGSLEPKEENTAIVSLLGITKIDPTVRALADLPLGWRAWRRSVRESWERGLKQE